MEDVVVGGSSKSLQGREHEQPGRNTRWPTMYIKITESFFRAPEKTSQAGGGGFSLFFDEWRCR